MGRESLGVEGVYVWLFEGQRELIDARVGKQKRSEFIREAVKAALASGNNGKGTKAPPVVSAAPKAKPVKPKLTPPAPTKLLSTGFANPKKGKG